MKAWHAITDDCVPGVVFAATRDKAMMRCVYSYCDAWNCRPVEAFRAIRLRRAPEFDGLADLVRESYGNTAVVCRELVEAMANKETP